MAREAFSVLEFCEAHSISRGTFYNMLRDGTAPRLMKVGKRTLVSREAAAEWRAQMEKVENSSAE